jgi:N6-adenosine-specific RNA methylase IME4
MEGRDFAELVADIQAHGLHEPIILLDGQVLDGRNRLCACADAGIEPKFETYAGNNPVRFVVSLNLRRRHLSESQRAVVAAKIANMPSGYRSDLRPAANLPEVVSQSDAANLLNVSERSVRAGKTVIDQAVPNLVEKVERGNVSVSAAADVATLPKEQQRKIVAQGEAEILECAKQIRAERAVARRLQNEELRRLNPPPIVEGKYGTIVIDPPWDMQKIEREVRPNQVEFDYPTMSEDELAAFPVADMAADDCHLFCWTTQKYLPVVFRLLEAWGVRYVFTMVWHKPGGFQPIGLAQYNGEFVLYGRRGSPVFAETKAFPCVFCAERREHSRKPNEFYDMIRRVTHEGRIDVFSRESREGFDQFGNETEKFGDAVGLGTAARR